MSWTDAQFTEIYNRTHGDVGRYCLRRLSPDDARDALTETYLVAWKRIDQLRDEDEALLWLYGIARNVVRNRARSARRSMRLVARLGREPAGHAADPVHQILRSEQDREVLEAIDSLSPADREIVRLRAYEELDYPDIALVLGCSNEAARQRLSRALSDWRPVSAMPPATSLVRNQKEVDAMPYEQLIDRVARTNAYPREHGLPEGWLGGDLEPDAQGSSIVATIQELKPTHGEPSGPNWGRIAAIAAVILAIVAGVFLFREDPDVVENVTTTTRPLDPQAQRLAIAEQVTNLYYGDDAGALGDAIVGSENSENFVRTSQFGAMFNIQILEVQDCEALVGDRVRCTVLEEDDLMRAFDIQAVGLVTVTFANPDSTQIVNTTWEPLGSGPRQVNNYLAWHAEMYPDPAECSGLTQNGIPDDFAECSSFILGNIEEYRSTENPIP